MLFIVQKLLQLLLCEALAQILRSEENEMAWLNLVDVDAVDAIVGSCEYPLLIKHIYNPFESLNE